MNGGDIDRDAVIESFSKIKQDIETLNSELIELKRNHLNSDLNTDLIKQIVKETVKSMNQRNNNMMNRINKKRKGLIINRIKSLAAQKNLSLSDIKDILVDQEFLCSKATFYRYVDKMKKKGFIDFVSINESVVVITL